MENNRTFSTLVRQRWATDRWAFARYLFSPTLLFADWRKYRVGPDKAAVAQCVKRLNGWFLGVTLAAVLALVVLDASVSITAKVFGRKIAVGVLAAYALSRCNEIFIAFKTDATDHLRPKAPTTDLKYYERIQLAMRSYVELVLAYGLIFRATSEIVGGFCPPLDALSAMYFSGITIATIGYGDIHPTHWFPRLVTVYAFLNGVVLIVVSFTVYVSRSIAANEFKGGGGDKTDNNTS
jgi:voltage-gated potassium channel